MAELARAAGFSQVSVSHEISPLMKLVGRGETTVVDAYLSPILRHYVDGVAAQLGGVRLRFMQSHGGLTDATLFRGKDAILSGPAGGVVGAVAVSRRAGFGKVIAFDMGGTSTDVSHYSGELERSYESVVGGVRLRSPMLRIHTVAAGGGSVCSFEAGRYRVGPRSAGADPGPACYGKGGPLTVTDCNLVTGKLRPAFFPHVFGPDGAGTIDDEAARGALASVAASMRAVGVDAAGAGTARRRFRARGLRVDGARDQADLHAAWARHHRPRALLLRRRRRTARLPRRRRARHDAGAPAPARRRAQRLRHGPRRRARAARAQRRGAA